MDQVSCMRENVMSVDQMLNIHMINRLKVRHTKRLTDTIIVNQVKYSCRPFKYGPISHVYLNLNLGFLGIF
jgi:hypothetical protein